MMASSNEALTTFAFNKNLRLTAEWTDDYGDCLMLFPILDSGQANCTIHYSFLISKQRNE